MSEARILKGMYKDGDVMACVFPQDTLAKIPVKGVEPRAKTAFHARRPGSFSEVEN